MKAIIINQKDKHEEKFCYTVANSVPFIYNRVFQIFVSLMVAGLVSN
jgi:hypothetical protein